MFWQYFKKPGLSGLGHNNTDKDTVKHRGNKRFTALFSLMLALMLVLSTITCAALDPIYLGFTSDVHSNTSDLTTWIESLKEKRPTLDRMIFGGDYAERLTTNGATVAGIAQQCVDIVKAKYPDTPCVLVRGNHDPANELYNKGIVYDGSDYAVYALDSAGTSYMDYQGAFKDGEINDLSNFLGGYSSSKPVFVVAHHPIHFYGGGFQDRITDNATELLTALNEHENVIFLWGHNHTVSDPYYGQVKTKDNEITTTKNGTPQPINFTYLSYGAMLNGHENGNAYGLLGTISEVNNGTKIDFDYKNLSGDTVSDGSVIITGGGTGGPSYQLVNSPQSGETYVIVAKSEGKYYALTTGVYSPYLRGEEVIVSGDYVTSSVSDDMLWEFTTSGDGFAVTNDSKYLKRESGSEGGLSLVTPHPGAGYADWIYDADKSLRTESETRPGSASYVRLQGSGSTYYFQNDWDNKSEIYLYKFAEGGPETYTVTFDSNGGSSVAPVNVASGRTVSTLPQPTKSGYTFDGWFTDSNFSSEFTSSTPVTADITIYAKWTKVVLPETYYELITSPESGDTYVVVAKSGSNYYALTTGVHSSSYLKGEEVTVSGDYVTSDVTDDMVWEFTTSGDGFAVKAVGDEYKYLKRESGSKGGFSLVTSHPGAGYADWIYDTADNSLKTVSTNHPTDPGTPVFVRLQSSGSTYYFHNDWDGGSEIYLYKLAEATPPTQYTLTLTGDNISADPAAGLIDENTAVTVTVAPASGKQVATFTVNGLDKRSELVNNEYTFTITENTTVAVTYEAIPATQYTLTLTGDNIFSVPASGSIAEDTEVTVTVSPASGKRVDTFTVNGVDKKAELKNNQYTFIIEEDTTIEVAYKAISTGGGGGGGGGGSGSGDKDVTVPKDPPEDFEEETPPEVPGIGPRFQDVSETAWYYEAVEFAVEKGLFVGTSDITFEPDTPMSRAMLVTVLWRMEGNPEVNTVNIFTDVADDAWYADAVLWANTNGIVSGYGEGLFGPNDNITREQMAAILYRYAEFKGYDVSEIDNLEAYIDVDYVSDWALAGMEWAVGEKLITGMTATTLVPQGNATRAQVASILMRFILNVMD